MAKLVEEMEKMPPVASKLLVDPKACELLREFAAEVVARNQPNPEPPVTIFTGLPVYIDKTLTPGQWQAVDRRGTVLEEGNLLPMHLRPDSGTVFD